MAVSPPLRLKATLTSAEPRLLSPRCEKNDYKWVKSCEGAGLAGSTETGFRPGGQGGSPLPAGAR